MKIQDGNIYVGKNSNNNINKRKYKKHSMSPFTSLNAGNVEYNISMFNKAMGNDTSTEVSGDSTSLGEAVDKPTYTFSYKGPIYRFKKVIGSLKEPIYTTAQNEQHAATMLRGKLKKKYGFDYKAKLDIDDNKIELVDTPDIEYQLYQDKNFKDEEDLSGAEFVGSFNNKDIYYLDGYYIVDNIAFVSYEDAIDYLEA